MVVSIPQSLSYEDYPCSPGQRRFLLIDQLDPFSSSLNVSVRWRLQGDLRHADIQFAIDALVRHHQALRTHFLYEDGEPRQRVLPFISVPVELIDLRPMAKTLALAQAEQMAKLEARVPFDIAATPLLRVVHIWFRDQQSFILLTAHHAICDGWSMNLLAAEFKELCNARKSGRKPILNPIEITYGDYSLWKNAELDSGRQRRVDEYWQGQLNDVKRFELDADFARPDVLSSNANAISISLTRRTTNALAAFAAEQGCTLFMVACAALLAILHKRSGRADISIGSQLTGRDDVDLEMLVGPCINTILVRSDLRRRKDRLRFIDLLLQVRNTLSDAFENQHVAPETLLKITKPTRDLSRNALFSINFVFQRRVFSASNPSAVELDDLPAYPTGASCDMDFIMMEHGDGWHAAIEYNSDLFMESTVRELLEQFIGMLQSAMRDPEQVLEIEHKSAKSDGRSSVTPRVEASPVIAGSDVHSSATIAANADGIEARLATIWSSILGVSDIHRDQSFFELGGHSLLAARLLARIDSEFDRRLNLAMLFKAQTLAEQARLLATDTSQPGELRAVVKLNARGTKPPLIAIVAMGNTASYYYLLARRLGEEQPFTIVQPFDHLHPRDSMPRSIEAVAGEYVRLIRAAQLAAPYRLVGWCITATLAFEIAQQLKDAKFEVSELVIVDAWAPGHRKRIGRLRGLLEEISYRAQLIYKDCMHILAGKQSWAGFIRNRHILARVLNALGHKAPHKIAELHDAAGEHGRWLLQYLGMLVKIYEPQPYDGDLLIFRSAEEPHGPLMDQSMGWKPLCGRRLAVVPIAGDHFSIFSAPGLDEMAAHITGLRPRSTAQLATPSVMAVVE